LWIEVSRLCLKVAEDPVTDCRRHTRKIHLAAEVQIRFQRSRPSHHFGPGAVRRLRMRELLNRNTDNPASPVQNGAPGVARGDERSIIFQKELRRRLRTLSLLHACCSDVVDLNSAIELARTQRNDRRPIADRYQAILQAKTVPAGKEGFHRRSFRW